MPRKRINWPNVLTTAQAADLAGVTIATICRWVRDGRLHAEPRGRVLLLDRAEVESVAAGRQAGATARSGG